MRPRTATIQVFKDEDLWIVDIGDPKASTSDVRVIDESLEDALILAVVQWKEKEGLDD